MSPRRYTHAHPTLLARSGNAATHAVSIRTIDAATGVGRTCSPQYRKQTLLHTLCQLHPLLHICHIYMLVYIYIHGNICVYIYIYFSMCIYVYILLCVYILCITIEPTRSDSASLPKTFSRTSSAAWHCCVQSLCCCVPSVYNYVPLWTVDSHN